MRVGIESWKYSTVGKYSNQYQVCYYSSNLTTGVTLSSETSFRSCKGKFVPVLNYVIKHHAKKILVEWRYSSEHYSPRHYMEVSGQIHAPTAQPPV
jgi:hypothetical protein